MLNLCGVGHRLTWICATALSLAPTGASAGAWPRDPGRTEIIFTATAMDSNRSFDRSGRALGSGRFAKQELAVLAEHGWSENLTLIVGGGLRHMAMREAGVARHAGSGTALAGARLRLWSGGGSVVSMQATVEGGGERSLPGIGRALEAPAEADLRVKAGHGFDFLSMPAFAEIQAGYRWRGGRHADEARLDATLGFRPIPQLLVLLQSFNATAAESDRRFGGGRLRRHKLQPSLVWDLNQDWSVQAGVFATIGGRETIQERGVVAALWRRF